MPDSGWKIPSDWEGEMQCIKLQWPDSPQWTALLHGLLYHLTRGRSWDADTGNIKNVQNDAWELYDANRPFIQCEGANDALAPRYDCGGGITVIAEDDEMGQVVTDVWVDETTNELVVQFGKCCERRFALYDVAKGETFEDDTGALPDEPDYPVGTPAYNPCAQATAIWLVWVDIVDRLLDLAVGVTAPWEVLMLIQQAYPSLKFGKTQLLTAYTSAISVAAQGYASETETQEWLQEVLCSWATISNDTGVGWTSDEWDEALSMVNMVGTRHFTPLDFATAFGDMLAVWFYAAQAIGPTDAKDITTRVIPTGLENCDCELPEEVFSYGGYYLGAELSAEVFKNTSPGWQQVGFKHLLTDDVHGVLIKFETFDTAVLSKRMAWNPTYLPGSVDTSTWGDTSENLSADLGAGKTMVYCGDQLVGYQLASQAGLGTVFFIDAGDMATPIADAAETLGSEIDFGSDTEVITVAKFYYIHKESV